MPKVFLGVGRVLALFPELCRLVILIGVNATKKLGHAILTAQLWVGVGVE
jgi:hypothetical protein